MRIPTDLQGRIRLFESAQRDRRLQAFLSPEAASAFGAYPLGTQEETLVVAVPHWVDLSLYGLLGRAIGRPVHPVPMEPQLVLAYIGRTFLAGEMPNFHTFADPDFLKEENLHLLVSGKVERPPAGSVAGDLDTVFLVDLALRSELANLDRYEGEAQVHPGGVDIPFSRIGGALRLFGETPGADERVLVKISFLYEGAEHHHGFRTARLRALPYVIHPTELQLIGLGPQGRATFWSFDRTVDAEPGETATCTYHFLNFGNRYRRALAVRLLGAEETERWTIEPSGEEERWTIEDFDRWFGAPWV